MNSDKSTIRLTRPLIFQVPANILHDWVVEYSDKLMRASVVISYYVPSPLTVAVMPFRQSHELGRKYSLDADYSCFPERKKDCKSERRLDEDTHKKHVNGNLLSFILKIIDVCSRHALRCIGQNTFR